MSGPFTITSRFPPPQGPIETPAVLVRLYGQPLFPTVTEHFDDGLIGLSTCTLPIGTYLLTVVPEAVTVIKVGQVSSEDPRLELQMYPW